ncbi:MAG: glutathione S-transferase family protein [Hyphomicrobiaceae bacterium]
MLKVYGRKSSFNLQKVMWLVGELGVPHQHEQLGGTFGGLDEPHFRAMNPHGWVPTIDDDGTIVWESHAILRYLAAKHGGASWWSADAASRAQVDQWMDWSQCSLQPDFLMGVFWGFYRTPEAQRDMTTVNTKIARTADHMIHVERLLDGQRYLLGDGLSLADITIGTHLYRYFNIDIRRPELPNVERWYARLQTHPAYREHVMVPFDDLYGRLAY